MLRDNTLNRRRFLRYCAAASGFATTRLLHAQEPDAVTNFDTLLAAIPRIMQQENVPGLQVAVLRKGETPLFESFGIMKADADTPVTADTLFEAASLTKPTFAYVVMKLVEEGVIDLDAPLNDIVEAPASDPPELVQQLTARLVLSHRTGFPNWYRGKDMPSLKPSQGRLFAYSGMAYEYLQRVVEKLTQQPLESVMQERLFKPLSMDSATVSPQSVPRDRLAHGHTPSGKPILTGLPTANAASTLTCTARDYARFAAIVLNPPAPSEVFLKPESLQEMFTPYIEAGPDIQWGLGWGLQTPATEPMSYFHWGNNNNAYHCFVVVKPHTGEGVVVMTNSGNGLRACVQIVPMAVSGDHPALRWNRVVGG